MVEIDEQTGFQEKFESRAKKLISLYWFTVKMVN
jgi:hypothetical protein